MHSQVVNEIWQEVKRHINAVDRAEVAESIVSILIENDEDPENIVENFRSDADFRSALAEYIESDKSYDDEDEIDSYLDDIDDPDY